MVLNCGCGSQKIRGAVNIDIEESLKPDIVSDFRGPLPFASNSVDKIYFFHTIEHIQEELHPKLLLNFWSVLKTDGLLYISYPEFTRCAENFIKNYRGHRDFWKRTIYGRQLHKSDHHVSLMYTPHFEDLLKQLGFYEVTSRPEPNESHNTIIKCKKREQLLPGIEEIYRRCLFRDYSSSNVSNKT